MDLLTEVFSYISDILSPYKGVIIFFLLIGLVLLILRIFRDRVIRFFSKNRKIEPIVFSETEIVKGPELLRRTPLFGALLFVPQGTRAIVAFPKNNVLKSFQAGERVIHFTSLYAFVQYVDIRRRTNRFLIVGALTRDGFQVSIRGKISWQVRAVLGVTRIKDPVLEILNEVEKAVRDIVSEYNHDQLVPHTESEPISDGELIGRISQLLNLTNLFRVINLHTIVIHKRTGDPDRSVPPPEPTEAEVNARLARETLQNRVDTLEMETTIAIHESQLKQEQAKIANEIRLQEAETIAQEEKILRSMREQEIILEQRRDQHRFEFDREKMYLQARTAVLAPLIQTYSYLLAEPIGRSSNDDRDVDRLGRAVQFIIEGLGNNGLNVLQGEFMDVTDSPKDAKTGLYNQIRDAASLEGFTSHNLQETSNGYWRLEVWVKGCRFIFGYNLGGGTPVIVSLTIVNSVDKRFRIGDLDSYHRLKLQQVIRKLLEKYGPC